MSLALLLALVLQIETPVDSVAAVALTHARIDDAQAIELDPFGALYVADAGQHVIMKMDTTGRLLERLGGPGPREGSFDRPMDVDPTNGLVLLVADAGNGRIQMFSRSHAFLGSIPLAGGGQRAGEVTYRRRDDDPRIPASGTPIAVASFGSNETYAIDADRGVVLQWDGNRRLTRVIGDLDAGDGALSEPVSLWAGPESLLFVADRGRGEVVVFDAYGSYVRSLGSGLLRRLVAVTGRGRSVLAVLEDAIVVFDIRGRRHRTIQPNLTERLVDAAVAPDGTIYVLTATGIYRLTHRGRPD